jgi:hypothetical protein
MNEANSGNGLFYICNANALFRCSRGRYTFCLVPPAHRKGPELTSPRTGIRFVRKAIFSIMEGEQGASCESRLDT